MNEAEENVVVEEFYVFEEEAKKMFLDFPRNLYSDKEYFQDYETEKKIIEGRHSLNHEFEVHFFLAYNKKREPLARAMLTFYHNDSNAYLGFFDCINNVSVGTLFLKQLKKFADGKLCSKLIGPYNCSWWVGKGLKVDNFGRPVYGEQYNMSYYQLIFQNAGFEPVRKYSTYIYNKTVKDSKYQGKATPMEERLAQGYSIVNFDEKKYETQIGEVAKLLLSLPNKDPYFKPINEKEFFELNSRLKEFISYKFSKLFYLKNQLVGFYIVVPNYSNSIVLEHKMRINMIKNMQSELSVLYFGADPKIEGLDLSIKDYIRREIGTKVRFDIFDISEDNLYYYKDTISQKNNFFLYSL